MLIHTARLNGVLPLLFSRTLMISGHSAMPSMEIRLLGFFGFGLSASCSLTPFSL